MNLPKPCLTLMTVASLTLVGCGQQHAESPGRAGASCATTDDLTRPEPGDHINVVSDEVNSPATLDELVSLSDQVVIGKVTAEKLAEHIPDSGDGEGVQMENLAVTVQSSLKGESEAGDVLTVRQVHRDHGRVPITNGRAPARVGQCGVWFLQPTSVPGVLTYTSAEGYYVVNRAGELVGNPGHHPVTKEVTSLTLEDLVARIT